ncbi:MAG: magnesium transporter [Magnetococcales bacterium]|nr:magnesium transporter [Magnetococcales bacterium]
MSMAVAVEETVDPEATDEPPLYMEAIERLYRKGGIAQLAPIIDKLLPADIAGIISSARDDAEAKAIFELISSAKKAGLSLNELDEGRQKYILSNCSQARIVTILEELPADLRSRLISRLNTVTGERLMTGMGMEKQREINALLQYLPGTAGSIMSLRFFALPESTTAADAVRTVRTLPSGEIIFYVYVVDAQNRLTGVTSLRHILLAQPDDLLKEFMNAHVFSVNTGTRQEKAAQDITRHGLLAMPVLDDRGVLRGIITVDDVLHVIQDIATQAMLKKAGINPRFDIMSTPFFAVAKSRIPWLFMPFLGGLVAAFLLKQFEHTLAAVIQLSFFMPMIFGMAGNVGSQAATVAVRNLATGKIRVHQYFKLLIKEIYVGLLIGGFYGLCLALYALFVFKSATLALTVGVSILSNITYAGIIASSIPMLLQKMGADPAIGGGPYVLTTIDVLGVINYLLMATVIYGL